MIEFEIPIEYYKTDIKPSNIIVVASASRYGDCALAVDIDVGGHIHALEIEL